MRAAEFCGRRGHRGEGLASLNGRKGTVLELQKEKGRVMVRLAAVGSEPERDVCAKPANLERGKGKEEG